MSFRSINNIINKVRGIKIQDQFDNFDLNIPPDLDELLFSF